MPTPFFIVGMSLVEYEACSLGGFDWAVVALDKAVLFSPNGPKLSSKERLSKPRELPGDSSTDALEGAGM